MSMQGFTRADYWRIKWQLVFLVVSCAAIGGSFLFLRQLEEDAQRNLRAARADLDNAQQAVDKIAEEEATIIEYIGRYDMLTAAGVVGKEDRLQFIETVAQLRAEHDLFPVRMNIGGQQSFPLRYDPSVREPGRPVVLHLSNVEMNLPLLHENDLLRLLGAILARPTLVQARGCELRTTSSNPGRYIRLGQHFSASCMLQWATFEVVDNGEARP